MSYYDFFGKMCFPSLKCLFWAKFCQFYEINFFSKLQHMKCNGICDFWSLEYKCRKPSWTMLLSLETFCGYLKKKTWEKFGRFCWYSVNLTNFVILLENFMKFPISQNWKKKLLFKNSVFFWGWNISTWWPKKEVIQQTSFGGKTAKHCHI